MPVDDEPPATRNTSTPASVATDPRRAWLLVATVAATILVASVVRVPGSAPADPGLITLTDPFHLVGYAALAFALGNARATKRDVAPGLLVGAVALATLYGVGIEVVQAPLPWRSLAAVDAAVNAVGAVLGAVGFWAWHRWRRGVERRFTVR